MAKENLYLVKMGGSSITDTTKEKVAKREVIARLLTEINNAKKNSNAKIIIGHGAGCFGHNQAKRYNVSSGLKDNESVKGATLTREAVQELNKIVVDAGIELGLPVLGFSPSGFAVCKSKKIVDGMTSPLSHSIGNGFLPIVHGDVMTDLDQGASIASTEEVFRFVSSQMKPDKIVLGTDTDGVFDSNPQTNPNAKLIEFIDGKNIAYAMECAGGATKTDVTGGMHSKLAILYDMVKSTGATGYIVNCSKPGVVEAVLSGREKDVKCTVVKP